MYTLLIIIHLIVCLFLISVVLLQSGKGAQIGAAFGGSSQTLFGSRGSATILNKVTTISAVVFMLTSFALTYFSSVTRTPSLPEGTIQKGTETPPLSEQTQPGPIQAEPEKAKEANKKMPAAQKELNEKEKAADSPKEEKTE